jgi:hypothetical protein
MTPSAIEIKSEEVQYDYPYEQSYNSTWAYSNDYGYSADPVTYYSASPCVDAANTIRTMRSDVGPELEVDQHRYVNNTAVFNMMDKYSQQHIAL